MNNKTSDNKFNNNVGSNKIEHIKHIVNNKKNRKYKKYNDNGLTFRYLEAYNNATSDCYVFLKSLEKLLNVEAEIKMSKKIHDEIKSGNLTYSDFLNHKLDVIDKTIKALDINFVNEDADEDSNEDNNDDGNGNSEEKREEKREKKLQRFRELVNEISGAYDKNDKNDKKDENDEDNSNDSSMSNSGNKRNEDNDKESDIKKDVKNDIQEEDKKEDIKKDKKEDIKEILEKKNAEKLEKDLKGLKIDSLLDIGNYRGESDKVLEFIKTFYDSLRRNLSILRKYFE